MKGRSIRYLDEGGLEVIEVDVPEPAYGEVQVKGGVCGICAWDLYTFRDGALAPSAAPPGHEGIGYVVKAGPGVNELKEGDRVAGGGFHSLRNLSADRVYRLPESELADEFWMVEPVSCVATGVDHCNLRIGDRVAVVGCGFMGLLLVQCLTGSFADEVIAVDIDPARLALAADYGADSVANPTDADWAQRLEELKALPIDTVVDASGSQGGLDSSVSLVRPGGHLNVFGWIHGEATFSGTQWHLGGYTAAFSSPSSKLRDTFPVAIRLIDRGQVQLERLVTHVVSLDEMGSLLNEVTSGAATGYIKGVVTLD